MKKIRMYHQKKQTKNPQKLSAKYEFILQTSIEKICLEGIC